MAEQWYLNPLKWVDDADLFDFDGKLTIHTAIDILKDKLVERPPDETTMVRGLFQSVHSRGLTARQQSAVDLARAAMQVGQTPTIYIAEQMGINRHSAFKLLKRADERLSPKMETSERNVAVYSKARVSKIEIDRVLSKMKVECAGCGERLAPARTALCHECLKQYGFEGERPERTRRWLDPMISLARRTARKQAMDRLMLVNVDIGDIAV